jgi:hypothetical protein
MKTKRKITAAFIAALVALVAGTTGFGQTQADEATVSATVGGEGGGSLVIEAKGVQPKTKPLYKAHAGATISIDGSKLRQTIQVDATILQGKPKALIFSLNGADEIKVVEGEQIIGWAIRRDGDTRSLEVHLKPDAPGPVFTVTTEQELTLPAESQALMLGTGGAIAFTSTINVQPDISVEAKAIRAEGLISLASDNDSQLKFQSDGNATLVLSIHRSGTTSAPVELSSVALEGTVDQTLQSALFSLVGTAKVTPDDGGRIRVLSGKAALTEIPKFDGFHLELNGGAYELVFDKPGEFTFEIPLAASVAKPNEWRLIDFQVGAGAIVPVVLNGIDTQVEFDKNGAVVPMLRNEKWQGFLPADGRCRLAWKPLGESDSGKLFFSTEARIDARVEAGLLRQVANINFTILQGELPDITLQVTGPGEIVGVEGTNVTRWVEAPAGEDGARSIAVTLSRPLEKTGRLAVRSQTPLGSFPARVAALRFTPEGSVRHAGHVRLSNGGAVRLDVTGVVGMSQSAPEQFPGEALKNARQVLVYRFPGSDYAFEILADQIVPEVGVSQVTVYEVTEADRILSAQIELDIREAPLRDWTLRIPETYSVVKASGASVKDYALDSLVENGAKNLKIIFQGDVFGRQLFELKLALPTTAAAGVWTLPPLAFPDAKSVRGQIGIVPGSGYRAVPDAIANLSELPLSSFQNRVNGLQLAWRIREANWTANVNLEALGQNIQADVFHLHLLKEGIAYGSVVLNYFVIGSPVSEWRITAPSSLDNVAVDGQDVQGWRHDGEEIIVQLHQPMLGPSTLLVTFEEPMSMDGGILTMGRIGPVGVQGERGYIHVVSPSHVKHEITGSSAGLLKLEALELPAEFRLLSSAPTLAAYQYSARPFTLTMNVNWFQPGDTVGQVVEFAQLNSQVSRDGQVITTARYFVKSRQGQTLRLKLPDGMRFWDARVNGRTVSARVESADGDTSNTLLVPIATTSGTAGDPSQAVEIAVRVGHSSQEATPVLLSPAVLAPSFMTEWIVTADQGRRLLPGNSPATSIRHSPQPESGYIWVGQNSLIFGGIVLLVAIAYLFQRNAKPNGVRHVFGFIFLLFAAGAAVCATIWVWNHIYSPANASTLTYSFAATASEQSISVPLRNVPAWEALISWTGIIELAVGLIMLLIGLRISGAARAGWLLAGMVAVSAGILTQPGGGPWFHGWLAFLLVCLVIARIRKWPPSPKKPEKAEETRKSDEDGDSGPESKDAPAPSPAPAPASAIIIGLLALGLGHASAPPSAAKERGADSVSQGWVIENGRLTATANLSLSGKPGDSFELLRSPATLTSFEGEGLLVRKREAGGQAVYVLVPESEGSFTGTVQYEMPVNLANGITVPTGPASVQSIDVRIKQAGWEVTSDSAVRVEPLALQAVGESGSRLILQPGGNPTIGFRLAGRNVDAEETAFFAETSNAFICGPGVVDASHHVVIRPSQGKVSRLKLNVPEGFTVSAVNGPVGQWRFDPDTRALNVEIEPAQASPFQLLVESQMTTGTLPVAVNLQALTADGAAGQIGKVGLAFTSDAQPEGLTPNQLSPVNATDFSVGLLANDKRAATEQVVLRNAYRFGANGGAVALTVAPVNPEVRVVARQVVSLGEERLVFAIDLTVDITRAGLFRLSFPLPNEFDIDGVSGDALSHWTEATEDGGQRVATLHLKGRTLGRQTFALSLSSPAPGAQADWPIPRFVLREATRQSGPLTITPERGLSIRELSRSDVSPLDSRELSANQPGAMAFQLLQKAWEVRLQIEALDSWVSARSLQEVTLREGVTQTRLAIHYTVENAGVKTARLTIPGLSTEEQNSVRASGPDVSEIVNVAGEADTWEIQFRRSIIGTTTVEIEYQKTSIHGGNGTESIAAPDLGTAGSSGAHVAVRLSGRLDLQPPVFPKGWQAADWINVPEDLQNLADTSVPALVCRVSNPTSALALGIRRHDLADSLKLRVFSGQMTTVLAESGDTVTEAMFDVEVVEQSTLSMKLPAGARLFGVFVNGKSVSAVVEVVDGDDAYRFHVKSREDAPTANIRATWSYKMAGSPGSWQLQGPELGVPLENVSWRVVVPDGFDFDFKDGTLQEVDGDQISSFTLAHYQQRRATLVQSQKQEANELLQRATTYLRNSEQEKARSVLQLASESSALDEASNEDARVQLRALQMQQAVVGLNTRRQRLYLDNGGSTDAGIPRNEQLEQSAASNPLMRGDINYDPTQVDALLAGNSMQETGDLKRMAKKLVAQQQNSEPASQAIQSKLPEQGTVYSFKRSVHVDGGTPLELNFDLKPAPKPNLWLVACLLIGLVAFFAMALGARVRR